MDQPTSEHFKSGFIAVMGRPNVGKSTLVNAILGQKVAAVSPRPQTTRKRQLGILTTPEVQIIFVDTPGVNKIHHKLGQAMNQQAREALQDCDLILFVVDAVGPPSEEDQVLADWILSLERQNATLLVVNKIDAISKTNLIERLDRYHNLLPQAEVFPVSALRGDQRQELVSSLIERLPEGPLYYPEEQVTDLFEREIAADLIRESALILLKEEVPHGIAVRVDEYKDRSETTAYIAATIFVERETHKGIVIGQNGSMLKKIGTAARLEIEALTGRKIYLELRVKVRKNWRDDENALKAFGFSS